MNFTGKTAISMLLFLASTSVVLAATDIPCDKLSAGIEVFQCKSVKREYKIGLKKDMGTYCIELEQLKLENGCVVNGLQGIDKEMAGSEQVFQKNMFVLIPTKTGRDATDRFVFQCDPRIMTGGVKEGLNVGHRLEGFTPQQMPGKDNGDRNQAWEDSMAKKGKRALKFWVVNPDPNANKVQQQTCILYNAATNTKLIEFNAEIQPVQSTKAPMTGPRPSGGGGFSNMFR